jgi:hypothetical protein
MQRERLRAVVDEARLDRSVRERAGVERDLCGTLDRDDAMRLREPAQTLIDCQLTMNLSAVRWQFFDRPPGSSGAAAPADGRRLRGHRTPFGMVGGWPRGRSEA